MKNRLKQIRKQKSITQEELAKAVGITRPYLSDIERGIKTPGGDIIIKIANYLKVPVEEIFFTTDVNYGELMQAVDDEHAVTRELPKTGTDEKRW